MTAMTDEELALDTARNILLDESASDTSRLTAARLILQHVRKAPPKPKRTALTEALERLSPHTPDDE